jgi:hypothetical protein
MHACVHARTLLTRTVRLHLPAGTQAGHDASGAVATGAPVVPWAVDSVALAKEEDAAGVPGLQEEFFAPGMVLLRLPRAEPLAAEHAAALKDTAAPEASVSAARDELMSGFLAQIPAFAETRLWGNLCCALFVPSSAEAAAPDAVQQCVDDLAYGTVTINMTPLVSYSNMHGIWGGRMHAGATPAEYGSGLGHIHNLLRVDNLEKQVMRYPPGHTLAIGTGTRIPPSIVKPLTGFLACGFKGAWDALTP